MRPFVFVQDLTKMLLDGKILNIKDAKCVLFFLEITISKECFECGKDATEDHHVIPESLGGTKTIPLCGGCHSLVHGGYFRRRDDHAELTKAGLQRAKERGVKLGNPKLAEVAQIGSDKAKALADEYASNVIEIVLATIREVGTYNKAAALLNANNVETPRGGKWTAQSICNLLTRMGIQRSDI